MKKMIRLILPILIIFVAFASGFIVAKRRTFKHRFNPEHQKVIQKHILRRLTWKLNLTEQQALEVKTILNETGQKFRKVHEQQFPKLRAIHKNSISKIKGILTKKQKKKFAKIRAKMPKPPFLRKK